ncbi:MAG: YgaP family membrane protein [Bacteroidota bacterium]
MFEIIGIPFFVLTSFVAFCPLYAPFGLKTTCSKKES